SMSGNNAGQVLNGSRMLFALAEQRQLPGWFAHVHPRFRTPTNAILFTSVVALAVALSGTVATISVVSGLARLLMYAGTAAATLRLRSIGRHSATFTTPGGAFVPVIAMLVCVGLAAGATRDQLLGGLAALTAGAVFFVVTRRKATAERSVTA